MLIHRRRDDQTHLFPWQSVFVGRIFDTRERDEEAREWGRRVASETIHVLVVVVARVSEGYQGYQGY